MSFDPFTLSQASSSTGLSETLSEMLKNNDVLKQVLSVIATSNISIGSNGNNTSSSLAKNYRTASVQLPKHYVDPVGGTVATIEIVPAINGEELGAEGKNSAIPIANAAPMDSFLLLGVTEQFVERYHISETFGDDFGVFFTGEQPKIFTFQGILINDAYRMWKTSFITTYAAALRGSVLAKQRIKASLIYDYIAVEGYIFNLSVQTNSEIETEATFSFSMLITTYEDFGSTLFTQPEADGQFGTPLFSPVQNAIQNILTKIGVPAEIAKKVGQILERVGSKVLSETTMAAISSGVVHASELFNAVLSGDLSSIVEDSVSLISSFGRQVPAPLVGILTTVANTMSGNYKGAVDDIFDLAGQVGIQLPPSITKNKLFQAVANPDTVKDMVDIVKVLGDEGASRVSSIPQVKAISSITRAFSGTKLRSVRTYFADLSKVRQELVSQADNLFAMADSAYNEVKAVADTSLISTTQGLKLFQNSTETFKGALNSLDSSASFVKIKDTITAATDVVNRGHLLVGNRHSALT